MSGPNSDHSSPETDLLWNWGEAGPRKVWTQPCGSGYGMPIVVHDIVYVLALEDDHTTVVARSADTGNEIWKWLGPEASYEDKYEDYSDGPYSTPCWNDGILYAITGEGVLVAIDAQNGQSLRELNLLNEFAAPVGPFPWGTSPRIFQVDGEDRMLINVGGQESSGVVCLNPSDFSVVWKSTDEGRCYATPRVTSVGNTQVAIVFTDKNVLGLNATDGTLLWSEKFGVRGDPMLRSNSVSPLVVDGDPKSVYVTAGPGAGVLKIDLLPNAEPAIENLGRRVLDSQFNNMVCDGDYLYGYTSKWNRQAQFRCIDRFDGEIVWEHDSELQRGSSILVDSHLLLLGEAGHLAAFEAGPEGPNVVSATTEPVVEGPAYTAPVLSNGRLFIRTERELTCFELRSQQTPSLSEDSL